MDRDSMFYHTYVLERMHLYEVASISLAQLIWELEQCKPYLQLDDEDLFRYENARSVLEELYAFSLEDEATETAQDRELITEQLSRLNTLVSQN